MPLYEYRCSMCGRNFEKLQKNAGEPQPVCPDCGSWETEKMISTFSSVGSSAADAGCHSGG